ncbi:hypothetical protein PQX77_010555 [Marasmius sp. AFHP31]|nr:hypothetical protein PQX77_010555 [Marasmius sp. AFHP31]
MVALDTPSMWSKPDFSRPKLAREMIKYSKSVPLDIEWSRLHPALRRTHLDLLSEALGQGSRISSLELVCRSESDLTTLLNRAIHPAPHLHSIRLSVADSYSFESFFNSFAIPENFLGKYAPRLVHFEVRGGNAPWGSPILHNLTTLSIGREGFRGANAPLEDIATTLRVATALEVVEISDFFLTRTNLMLPQGIKLPRLKRLYLSADGAAVAALLHCMSFPASTTIHLKAVSPRTTEDSLVDCISSLFLHVSTTPNHPRTIKALSLDHFVVYDFVLRAWNVGISHPGRQHIHRNSISREPPPPLSLFGRLLASLGTLVNLETLEISLSSLPSNVLAQSFGRCPFLHTIAFTRGECALSVIRSLSRTFSAISEAPAEPAEGNASSNAETSERMSMNETALAYPALKTLVMTGVDFDGFMSPLIDSLQLRAKSGCPVKEVDLNYCRNILSDDVGALQENGGVSVSWDGYVPDSDKSDSGLDDLDSGDEYDDSISV